MGTAAAVTVGAQAAAAEPSVLAEADHQTHGVAAAAADERRAEQRGWAWPLWALLVILVAAGMGLLLGNTLGSREGSLFPDLAGGATQARPTIVIGTRPTAVPPVVEVASPPVIASPVAKTPAQEEDEYVVEAGDSLRSIAQQELGDDELWMRLYERNRDVIGPNPNALQPGMRLRIPRD